VRRPGGVSECIVFNDVDAEAVVCCTHCSWGNQWQRQHSLEDFQERVKVWCKR
jgi:hypothetical protein